MCKEPSGILILVQNNEEFDTFIEKTSILDTYFQSVFMQEDFSNFPVLETNICTFFYAPYFLLYTENWIITLWYRSQQSTQTWSNPSFILKHLSPEIAPVLKVIFTQSLSSSSLPKDWLTANMYITYFQERYSK